MDLAVGTRIVINFDVLGGVYGGQLLCLRIRPLPHLFRHFLLKRVELWFQHFMEFTVLQGLTFQGALEICNVYYCSPVY